jgi:hypothetical protein
LGQEGPLNAFFFLLIGVISQIFAMVRKEGNKHTWRAQYTGELYAAFGKDESIDSLPIGWTVGAMIYFTGEVSGSSPGWPSCAK